MKKLVVATFVATIVTIASAQAAVRTFEAPRVGGVRLDWCLYWAKACGKPAADAFCQQRGFSGALDFSKASNIGYRQPTRLITGQVCAADFCSGFRYVTCAGS